MAGFRNRSGASLLLLLPTDRMIWVAAAGVSAYLWLFNRDDAQLRAAAAVLAALSVQEFWGHVFFNLVALPRLRGLDSRRRGDTGRVSSRNGVARQPHHRTERLRYRGLYRLLVVS